MEEEKVTNTWLIIYSKFYLNNFCSYYLSSFHCNIHCCCYYDSEEYKILTIKEEISTTDISIDVRYP